MTSSESTFSLIEFIKISKRVYIIGNGGSYANAMHICNDLLSKGVKAYTLDPSTLVAFSNDFGFNNCFAHWLNIVAEENDLLIAMSGSGKSENILRAIEVADRKGMNVYKIFGNERGEDMQQAEESQLRIGHEVWKLLGL